MKHLATVFFICFYVFFFFNASVKTFAQSRNYPDSLSKFVIYVEGEIDKINGRKLNTKILSKQIPSSELDTKKIKVNVYIIDNIVRKLDFVTFDDSYATSSKEVFYFDSIGKLICNEHKYASQLRHTIFSEPFVMIYSKIGNKVNSSTLIKGDDASYILATNKFIADYYLSNFLNVKYSTFDVSKNTSIILKTLVATDLRKEPNAQAALIKKLPKGSELQYLDRSLQQDSLLVGKEKWVWLKIRDNKKQEGWIWGHPSIVKEY